MTTDAYEGQFGAAEPQDPDEALDVDHAMVEQIKAAVNERLEEHHTTHGKLSDDEERQMAASLIQRELESIQWGTAHEGRGLISAAAERAISDAVLSRMFGLGQLDGLLDIEDVEDIYVEGPNPVILKHFGGRIEVVPPIAASDDDLVNQINAIAANHGSGERELTASRPFLDLDIRDRDARLAAMWQVTRHPVVTIRRHRFVNVQLEHLVSWGTISRSMQAFLHALVVGRKNIFVVGGQGVGKTTTLRALCAVIDRWERFTTLETEYELLLDTIPGRFPLLTAIQEKPGSGEELANGRMAGQVTIADAFPKSLRHSNRRAIVGELRDSEIGAVLHAMSRGLTGSMASFHADSAIETFESLAQLIIEHKPSMTYQAAMRQIAAAVDYIIYIDRRQGRDPNTGEAVEIRFITDILEVGRANPDAIITSNSVFAPKDSLADTDPRGYPTGFMPATPAWRRQAGFNDRWLLAEEGLGGWVRPFPAMEGPSPIDEEML